MITIDATTVNSFRDASIDWSNVSESELRFELFLGDVQFRAGETDFSTRWGWVPVLDFALGMSEVLSEIQPEQAKDFEFTESDATISVVRNGDLAIMSANYAAGVIRIDFEELRGLVRGFTRLLGRRLAAEHPALLQNQAFLLSLERAM